MEHIRMSDNITDPHPTESSAAPLIQTDPSLLTPNRAEFDVEDLDPAWPSPPPSAADFQYAEKSWFSSLQSLHPKLAKLGFGARSKPLIRGFERPRFSQIAILTVLCLTTYPAFYILKIVAKDKSLFIVRAIVSVWCSGVGFALGYILLGIGARHLEAATWATVIHMSHKGGGMKLRDLARGSSNPTSFMPAFHVFRFRFRNRETSKRSRKSYDKQPWSLFLGFFVVLAILAPVLPFLFGRITDIKTFVTSQSKVYREVLITGDLTQEDSKWAATRLWAFQFGWLSYGSSTSETAELLYENETVYFAQPRLSQLIPGGFGPGALQPTLIGLGGTPNNSAALTGSNTPKRDVGVVLRHPQWGIRIHCEKLPNPEVNLVPLSSHNNTYAFIPRDFLRGLYGVYGMELPTMVMNPDLNFLTLSNDTIPPNIDPATISVLAAWPDKGETISLDSLSIPVQEGDWTTIETVLIRIATTQTPSGRFPVHLNRTFGSSVLRIGYDAAVCVQKYEAWIIETYNTSITPPSALRVVGKGNTTNPLPPSGKIQGPPITNTRYLNITGKGATLLRAHENTVRQMNDDGDHNGGYTATATAISFTESTGDQGYTELSPNRFAVNSARVSAVNVLPFLVGSGHVVAQSYEDETLASVAYKQWQLISLPVIIWILGVIGELFVPALPFNVPRREFGVYSWLVLFQSQGLQFEAAGDLDKLTSLDELEEKYSNERVKFVV